MNRRGLLALLPAAPLAKAKPQAKPVVLELPEIGELDWAPKLTKAFRDLERAVNEVRQGK